MKTYAFRDTLLLVNGVELSGYDEGDDVITLARRNDSAMDKVGVDGEMSVALSSDLSGTVTFRLMQTSDSNAYLSTLVNGQERGVFVPIFIQFRDTRGGDLGSGSQGYITKPADMTRGQNVNNQEWVVVVEDLSLLHLGGE